MSETLNDQKYKVLVQLFEEDHLLLHVHTGAAGVMLPPHLMSGNNVTLKLSRFFRGQTQISDQAVDAELLFGNEYFNCHIPFTAVWGVTSCRGSNVVWPENAPDDVLAQQAQSAPTLTETKRPKGAHLKRVK